MKHSDPDVDDPVIEPVQAETERKRVERRRWLTLAEVLGVAGLLIAGLTLWNNISMRRGQDADRQAEQQQQAAVAATEAKAEADAEHSSALVTLEATAKQDGKLLDLSDTAGHRIQNVKVQFPPSLGVPTQGSVLEPRIDSEWVKQRLLAITDGGPDAIEGSVPIQITSSYFQGEKPVSDAAIYDLVFRTEGQMLSGRALKLRGLLLVERSKPGASPARLDDLWAVERKRIDALKN